MDQRIGHYRVVGTLGVGGMGVVYEAEDGHLARRVALKFLPDELADDADAIRRFERESQIVALLNNPHICTVYAIDRHQGRPFMAMERVEGVTLRWYMASRKLKIPEVLDISAQIASALHATHTKGIVHRDIKPGNIIVSETGHVKVLDFGLARRFQTPQGRTEIPGSTIPGRPLGTLSYMAPERIMQLPLDPRCDLFSLGVVVYEMVTGTLPFKGDSPFDTVTSILEGTYTRPTKLAPASPVKLEAVIQRLLCKLPDDRYQSARDLLDDLAAIASSQRSSPMLQVLRRLMSR